MTKRLSFSTKLLYGAGDIGFSLTTTIIGASFLIFLTDVVGLSPGIAGIAIFIGRSWDYVNDPLIGHISDRTRTRWGRRRPFLLFGALPFALAFAMMWWRPPWDSSLALAVYYAVAYVVFDAAATFVYMPYYALTPELTSDYDERTALTSFRMFFSIVGSLIAFIVPTMIVDQWMPANSPRAFLMGGVFGLLSALPLWLTFAGTQEREAFVAQERPRLIPSLRAALKNRPFVFGLAIYLLTWIPMGIIQSTLFYYVNYVVRREEQTEGIMAAIFVTAIVALPFWTWVSRRWSKRHAYAVGIAFWAVVQILLITLGSSTPMPVLLTLCVMAGIGVAAAHVIPWAILPDAVEWGELETGERHEGTFYSLVTLSQKIASSIAVPAAAFLLEFTGYTPLATTQPPSAVLGVRILIGPVPAVLLCTGILFAVLYPLGREQYTQIAESLEIRRAGTQAGGSGR